MKQMFGDKNGKRLIQILAGVITTATVLIPAIVFSQTPSGVATEGKEPGMPITDPLVVAKCGACHMPDAKNQLSRISWMRSTPEGWEEAIKRMVRLNGLTLTPDEARHILRYLSDKQGLAPSEAEPVEDYAEHRMTDEVFPPDPNVRAACGACHQLARPLSWRRAPEDWKYLKDMHLAFFPSSTPFAFDGREHAQHEEDENHGAEKQLPVDIALAYIAKATPLQTPAWSQWQASMAAPKLAGRWLVTGTQPGKGKFFGEMVIAPGAEAGNFTTKTTLHFVNDPGHAVSAEGASLVYTGFQWRGRSKFENGGSAPGDRNIAREVMLVSADRSSMKGRWFWGQYQEFGLDISMTRASDTPVVLGTDIYSLRSGTSGNKVVLYGDHLPQDVDVSSIDFGPGVKVTNLLNKSANMLTMEVDVAANAATGTRAVSVGNVTMPNAFAVYKRVDFIKISPGEALAHLGSEVHPMGYVQFEADGYSDGPDGKANTADDIDLGPMPATWKLEEFIATYGDDDTSYVGKIDAKTGLFTPASDGPSPTRTSMRNNYGDVWAVATVKPDDSNGELSGKSYMVVTVPQYQIFDQPEVGQ